MINKIDLPYPVDALEPYYSKETLTLHYDILYAGYVNNTNLLVWVPTFKRLEILQCENKIYSYNSIIRLPIFSTNPSSFKSFSSLIIALLSTFK